MEAYKREFIEFLQGAGVLKFGDFTAKSGRKIPYFVNAGMIKTGDQITKMGEFYDKVITFLWNLERGWLKKGKRGRLKAFLSHFRIVPYSASTARTWRPL